MRLVRLLILLFAFPICAVNASQDEYVLTLGDDQVSVLYTDQLPLSRVQEMRRDYGHDFLWFRRGGRAYVIRDRAFLSRVEALFAPKRALRPELRSVNREESHLDDEIDAIEDRDDGRDLDAATEAHLLELKARMREVSRRQHELERREEELEREAELQLWGMVDEAIRRGVAERV